MKNLKEMWTNLAYTLEDWRISLHLRKAEMYLRNTPSNTLSKKVQCARERNLALLRGYRQAGRFPKNNSINRPILFFKDNSGTLCAVAHLVAASGEHELVNQVAQNSNNAAIKDIKSVTFDKWIEKSGLTKNELAIIQPTYFQYDTFVFLVLGLINFILCLINIYNIRLQRKNFIFSLVSLFAALIFAYVSNLLLNASSLPFGSALINKQGESYILITGIMFGGIFLGLSLASLLIPKKMK